MMNVATPLIWVLLIIFLSALIRAAIGFGDALVAMPLLAIVVDIKTAAPLVAFVASTIAITVLLSKWRAVDVKDAWRLILLSLAGIPFGLVLLRLAPEHLVKAIMGVLLIAYGLYSLIAPRLPTIENEKSAYVFGFVAGVLGGAYNTNGPPVVMYGMLRRWPPEHFRATLQCYFLFTGFSILVAHGLAGSWTASVLRFYLYSIPVILLAIYVGELISRHIPRETFSRVVYVFLIAMGVVLMF